MAALNFPLNPPLNYRYPETPIPGVATYSWDGEKWMVLNGDAGGGGDVITGPVTGDASDIVFTPAGDISAGNIQDAIVELDNEKIGEAPIDGKQYARKDAAWSEVAVTGGGGGDFLPLTGGTITGDLTVTNVITTEYFGCNNEAFLKKAQIDNAGLALANISSGTFDRSIAMTGDPLTPLGIATRQYVDTKANLDSPLFIGNPRAPTAIPADNDETIATTAYVTAKVAGITAAGGIPEAPIDGQQYARQSAAWAPVGGGIPEAPADGVLYGRQDTTWLPVPTGGGGGGLTQAEADALYVNVTGDNVTGALYVYNLQVNNLCFMNSLEVDTFSATTAEATTLTLGTEPTANSHAATKYYVDTKVAAGGGGGLTQAQADLLYVNVSGGDSILGDLNLENGGNFTCEGSIFAGFDVSASGNGNFAKVFVNAAPTVPLEVATKGYVDSRPATDTTKVLKAGDTMTGPLLLPSGTAAAPGVAFSAQTNTGVFYSSTGINFGVSGAQKLRIDSTSATFSGVNLFAIGGDVSVPGYGFASDVTSGIYRKSAGVVAVTGNGTEVMSWAGSTQLTTCTGPIQLPSDPAQPLHAATKQYVDNKPGAPDATKLPLAGGTMTGALLLAAGSSGSPPISFAAETGMGLWRKSSGVLSIIVGGTEMLNMSFSGSSGYIIGSAADIRSKATGKFVTSDAMWDAAAPVALTDAAAVITNLNLGIDFTLLFTSAVGATRALNNPTNSKPGQKGVIYLIQDATGSRAVTWGTAWKFAGGTKPTLTTAANATDVLSYVVKDVNNIFCSFLADCK